MSFELTVGPTAYNVTASLFDLVSIVLHRPFDFPQMIRMFSLSETTFDPSELLLEAEILKDMAAAHTRPYIDVGRPLEGFELDGLRHFPHLLKPTGQIVKDWSEFVQMEEGQPALISQPPTLVAGRGRLSLVDALAIDVADAANWERLPRVTAETFRWEHGQLLADGEPQMDVPDEFLKPGGNWTEIRYTNVPVSIAWADEIEQLLDACRDGMRIKQRVRART